MIPRLKEQFNTELKQKIMSDLQLSNVNEIPSLEKIIINIGDGKAATDGRALESMVDELTAISGQKPVIRRAKKSIAGFKIREGNNAHNRSGGNFIYMAFAEHPFVGDGVSPVTAR